MIKTIASLLLMTAAQPQQTGRFLETETGGLRCAWSGCQIALRFKGTEIQATLRDFAQGKEGNVLAVLVDAEPPRTLALKPGSSTYQLAENLEPGEHTVRLFKQTEASVGSIEFESISIPGGTLLPPPPKPARRIEFIGDSITCGYGNEALSETESFKPSTENHYLSYGQITARVLDAEAHVAAWSGEGIIRNAQGNVVHPLPTIIEQVLPPLSDPAWDFSKWIPQVVVINLGSNDFLTGIPDRAAFVATYLQLLEKLNRLYRSPQIFCCLGPMIIDEWPKGEVRLTTARAYLQELQTRAQESGIEFIHLIEFESLQPGEFGADWHPNLAAHQRMANTLTKSIRKELDW